MTEQVQTGYYYGTLCNNYDHVLSTAPDSVFIDSIPIWPYARSVREGFSIIILALPPGGSMVNKGLKTHSLWNASC